MSSNINIVDKLNPMSFEKNDAIDSKILKDIRERLENYNKKTQKKSDNKDNKVTISLSQTEKDLTELETLYKQCLIGVDILEKNVKKNIQADITNYQLSTDDIVKKKLLLNLPLHRYLLLIVNPQLNLL